MLKEAEKGSISIAFVQEALQGVRRQKLATEPLLRAAGISPGLLQSADARVTPENFGALWLAIARALDDEFFGLDSRRMKVGSYALMCRLGLGCERLREAALRIDEFLNVTLDDTRIARRSPVPRHGLYCESFMRTATMRPIASMRMRRYLS